MLGGGGVYSLKSTIVINDKDARTLVNDGMFDSNSLLNDAGRLLLHELVHAAADAAGIKLPADLEEVIAHQIESVIANNLLRLRNVLLNANPPTANQQNRVRTHLINIRNSIKQSRDAAKTYKPSTRQANEDLLDLLRLSDQDGNGIPDIIDNMLQNLFPDGIPQWLQDILDEVFSPTGPNSGAPADIDGDGGLTPVTPDYP